MLRIDFGVPVLVCLDKSPFPITFQRLMCVGEKITSNELRSIHVFVMLVTSMSQSYGNQTW